MKKLIAIVLIILVAAGIVMLYLSRVDNDLTQEDLAYADTIMNRANVTKRSTNGSYENEVAFIQDVQRAVLQIAPVNRGLPEGAPRNPKVLCTAQFGLCYDRSRVIEMILRSNGFETRHVSIYSTEKTDGSEVKALISTSTESHAVSEVKTSRGWLLIDSNDPWMALDDNLMPHDAGDIREKYATGKADWFGDYYEHVNPIYKNGYTYVYGLYSRHGRFYPPYNPIPDINWTEFFEN